MSESAQVSTTARGTDALATSRLTQMLLAGGVVGPALFIVVFLIEGATRPGYSAWSDFVSALGLSEQGWEQIANFIVCGVLTVGFAVGLRRALVSGKGATWGPILLGIFGLSLIVAGVFVTDPSVAYPPGTLVNHPQTLHGTIHGVNALVVFPSLTAACFVLARRFASEPGSKGWARYSVATACFIIVFFVFSTAVGALSEHGAIANAPTGLLQRISIITGWVWVSLVAFKLLREARSQRVA